MYSKIILPKISDIVWFTPPISMGLKARPCMIIGVSELKHQVVVSFGTSQKTFKLYPSEFLISEADGVQLFELAGLSYDTKFDLDKTKIGIYPFTTQFFSKAPRKNNIPYPKLGSVHMSYCKEIERAKKNGGW